MAAYNVFANYYDSLTTNISYKQRADYFNKIIKNNTDKVELLLDLACGTGSLSCELSNIGYDVIGIDNSIDMLCVAREKNSQIMFLHQDMRKLDLYGTIDVTIAALDSINHLVKEDDVLKVFKSVSLFTRPDGLFIFDLNSVYKHQHILSNNTFVYDYDDVYCIWQNTLNENNIVEISLDFFCKREKNNYIRYSESFRERAYPHNTISNLLNVADFDLLYSYGDDTYHDFDEKSERIIYVAKKKSSPFI